MFSFRRGPLALCTFCLYSHSPFFLFGSVFLFYFVWAAFTGLLAFSFRFPWLFCFTHPFVVLAAVCFALYCRFCIFLSIHYFYCLSDKNVSLFYHVIKWHFLLLIVLFCFCICFYCLSDIKCFTLWSRINWHFLLFIVTIFCLSICFFTV